MRKFSGYPANVPAMRVIVRKKIALRIGGAVLWGAGWITACALWGRHSTYLSPFNWTFLGILIGCLGWRIFKLGELLRDKPFEGTITSMKLAYVYYTEAPWTRAPATQEPQVTACILLDDGETVQFKFPIKDIHPKDYYGIGDRVRHYRCLPYLEKESKPEDICICVACGKYSYMHNDRCEFCRKPLLK